MKLTMMQRAQPPYLKRLRIVVVMSLYFCVATMAWLLDQQTSLHSLDGDASNGVATYSLWILLLIFVASPRIGATTLLKTWQQLRCFIANLVTLSACIKMSSLSLGSRKLAQRFDLFALRTKSWRNSTISIVLVKRFSSVESMLDFSQFFIATFFAKVIFPILQSRHLAEQIRMKPLTTSIAKQLALFVRSRSSGMPISLCVQICHMF